MHFLINPGLVHDYVLPEFTFEILIHKISKNMDNCLFKFFKWYFGGGGILRMGLF